MGVPVPMRQKVLTLKGAHPSIRFAATPQVRIGEEKVRKNG